jgi:HK97 family phage major capsid protein
VTLQADYIAAKEEIATKRLALKTLFENANKETDPVKRDEVAASIKTANTELAELVDKIEPLQELVEAEKANTAALKSMRQSGARQIQPEEEEVSRETGSSDEVLSSGIKSIHELLMQGMDANGIKSYQGFRGEICELAVKTLLTRGDATPLEQRLPSIQLSAQEERTVADLMLSGTTTAQKISYYEETTFTNAAVETAEGDLKGESALAFTLREDNVRKIATWIPVTDEMLEDVPGFESYLRGRMAFMVKAREELQLLRGDGTGQNILGVYNRNGVQTVTGYGLSTIDSILKGITEIQKDAFVEPTALVVHPNDWFDIRTSKDLNGNYLLGPATLDPNQARPWGLQVRVTTNALENTALVGAFNQAQVYRRSGIAIAISTENEDYFVKNKVAVRAEERLALAVYRPAAFCKVEAIVQGS